MAGRQLIGSASAWEAEVGYSRAVRVGNRVYVAGTTACDEYDKPVFPGDAFAQTKFALARIEAALKEAGASLTSVVRTRMFVTDISRWREFGRAHGQVFHQIRPASSMIEVKALILPELLIEIEVEAEI